MTWLFKALIKGYQWFISPVLPGSCRYYPTCSSYALEALNIHGPLKGGWMGLKRILRCHPWNDGGFDPVPDPRPLTHHQGAHRSCGHPHHNA